MHFFRSGPVRCQIFRGFAIRTHSIRFSDFTERPVAFEDPAQHTVSSIGSFIMEFDGKAFLHNA